jgi:RNA polymerase sigma factor (TIGR02999 family)
MLHRPKSCDRPKGVEEDSALQERRALNEVFSLVYEELRRLASSIRRSDPSATLSPISLVNEAWLKLKDSPQLAATTVPHFKAIAARAMRQVLVDTARKRMAQKRGGAGDIVFVTLDDFAEQAASCDAELLGIHSALDRLAKLNPRQARVVECRFFGGLNVVEAASELGVSESVIERDWRAAKAWLAGAVRPDAKRVTDG